MTYLRCRGKDFIPGERKLRGYSCGKSYKFVTSVMICVDCGDNQIASNQIAEFRIRLEKAKKQKII